MSYPAIIGRKCWFRLPALCIGLLSVFSSSVALCDQSLTDRINKALIQAQSLTNVEIVFLYTTRKLAPITKNHVDGTNVVFEYLYVYDNGKFRAQAKPFNSAKTSEHRLLISTFDGDTNFTYSGDNRYLTVSSKPPLSGGEHNTYNPLILPFAFLAPSSDECQACPLRFDTIATNLESINNVELIGETMTNGTLYASFRGEKYGRADTTWNITVGQNDASFAPTKMEFIAPGQNFAGVYLLSNYTALGGYWVPSNLKYRMVTLPLNADSMALLEVSVDIVSLNLNKKHDLSLFRLDSESKSSRIVWDGDQNKIARANADVTHTKKTMSITRNVIVLLIFISVSIIAYSFLRPNKKQPS